MCDCVNIFIKKNIGFLLCLYCRENVLERGKSIKIRRELTKVITERKKITRFFNKRKDILLEKICTLLYVGILVYL